MTFVDTSAWFASAVEEDINHSAPARWLEQKGDALVTSDYVVDEILTLLRARDQPAAALTLGRQFFIATIATVLSSALRNAKKNTAATQSKQELLPRA